MESSDSEPFAQKNNDGPNGRSPEEAIINGAHPPPPSLIPPYWSHRRYESYSSIKNTKPPPITLEDHTEEPSEQSGAVWAAGVTIDDHVLVSGTVPSVGNFVVWHCRIETLDVCRSLCPSSCMSCLAAGLACRSCGSGFGVLMAW